MQGSNKLYYFSAEGPRGTLLDQGSHLRLNILICHDSVRHTYYDHQALRKRLGRDLLNLTRADRQKREQERTK